MPNIWLVSSLGNKYVRGLETNFPHEHVIMLVKELVWKALGEWVRSVGIGTDMFKMDEIVLDSIKESVVACLNVL